MSRSRSNVVWILPLVLLAVYMPAVLWLGFAPSPTVAALDALRGEPPPAALQSLAQAAYLIVLSALSIFISVRCGWLVAAVFSAAAIGGDFAASRFFSASVAVLPAVVGLGLVWGGATLGQAFAVWRTQSRLRGIFAGRLAKSSIREILRDPDLSRLESESRTLSGLSCRLIVPAGLLPGEAAAMTETLSSALNILTAAAIRCGGMIDAISACGFTAFWNAPLADPDHAQHACAAAAAMHKAIGEVNVALAALCRRKNVSFAPLEIAVGVASGPATVGRIETDRPTFSAGGLMLEIAVRLQQIAARYGAFALTNEQTQAVAGADFAFLEVDYRVMEPNGPVRLYALQGDPGVRASPRFRAQSTFHNHLFAAVKSKQWKKARDLLEQCRNLSGASVRLYDLHAARIAFYERNPPPDGWDGAYRPPMH